MHITTRTLITAITLAFAAGCSAQHGDEPSLTRIQQILASKKYVDLTHVFAPGIPRWPGFPDETRKTIYWYDKRPDTAGTAFSLSYLHMLANGAPMSIRLHISSKVCVRWIRLISRR